MMSSLRRDLLERRLWPIVVLLLVAVIAVPLMLRKNARADVPPVPPAPPVAGAVAAAKHTPGPTAVPAPPSSLPRNPFASGTAGVNATPGSPAGPGSDASGTTATSSPTPATPAPVASTVSPPPAASSTGSPAAPTTTITTTTTSTAPSSQPTTPEAVRSWTVYGVAVRVGTGSFGSLRSDVARLTPLPSVAQPKAMFMGVMAGGKNAVFALGAGVQHSGPGVCRPDRKQCAAIVLSVGQTEQIIAPVAGGPRQFNLSLVAIASRVTHSSDDALAAFRRHSAAGLCELDLASPVTYGQGTVSAVADTACEDQSAAVPFPGGLAAP